MHDLEEGGEGADYDGNSMGSPRGLLNIVGAIY